MKNLKERNDHSFTESNVFKEAWQIRSKSRRFMLFWPTQEFSDSPNSQVYIWKDGQMLLIRFYVACSC
jgi:hypothetical protein